MGIVYLYKNKKYWQQVIASTILNLHHRNKFKA